jgi:hypothetical protein
MKITEIKSMMEQAPFRPFTVLLENGHDLKVTGESELLFPRNRPGLLIIFDQHGAMTIFEDRAVTAIEQTSLKP